MTQQNLVIGAQDAKNGDTGIVAFTKLDANATDAETRLSALEPANALVHAICPGEEFPNPVVANTHYKLCGNVTISNPINHTGSGTIRIDGTTFGGPLLTYSGSGNMINNTGGGSIVLDDIQVTCPGAVFARDTGGGVITGDDIVVLSCLEGVISNGSLELIASNFVDCQATNSIKMTGTSKILILSGNAISSTFLNNNGLVFTGATFSILRVMANDFDGPDAAGYSVIGDAGGANMLTDKFGFFTGNTFGVSGQSDISGISQDDEELVFSDNGVTADTGPVAFIIMSGNAVATIIPGAGGAANATLVAGTSTVQSSSHWACTTAGRMTYMGLRPLKQRFFSFTGLQPTTGTNKDMELYLCKNGVLIAASLQPAIASNGKSVSLATTWEDTVVTGDYYEQAISTADGTDGIVTDFKFLA